MPGISRKHLLLLSFLLLAMAACKVTKNLGPNEQLLIKNRFHINTSKVSADDLSGYLQQQPNKKLFGLFRANIAFYYLGSKGKETKFKKWLKNTVGAAPVILDTGLCLIATKQMVQYLANKGYFNSRVKDSVSIKKKKATVFYLVKTTVPYKIRKLSYTIPDTQLARFIYRDTASSVIKIKRNYDAYKLDEERTRISTYLANNGFYGFSPNYIVYHVDSAVGSKQMDIRMEVSLPQVPSPFDPGQLIEVPHKRYYINNIYIYSEFDHMAADTALKYDTLVTEFSGPKKSGKSSRYYFLSDRKMSIKPRTIAQSIFIEPGSYYNLDLVNKSYSRLAGLQVFKYVNLRFAPSGTGPDPAKKNADPIDCRVQLSRSAGQSFSVSADGTNSAGAFGLQGGLTYSNRNIFKGAQLLRIGVNISAQSQPPISDAPPKLFNVLELGLNASLSFPQFLLPIRPERLPKSMQPKTTFTLGYNFQRQQDYDRHITNATFGYTWIQNKRLSQTINPIEIALVKVFGDSAFEDYLNSLTDPRLKYQYTDHLVAGLKYTLQYTSQELNRLKDYIYIKTNFETGGNLLYTIDNMVKGPKNEEGYFTLLNIQYAQYVRPDFDFRYYNKLGREHMMVYRFYTGIGIPYGNSIALPFEKAFFAGGANDLRGWKMGYIGPGSYHNDTLQGNYNQFGDMQVEANIEYRFPIYKVVKGSLFFDLGNVWLIRPSPDLPGGVINIGNFIPEIAISTGFGIRLDFNFFMVRLDPAIPIKVPWYPKGDRWYFNKMQLQDIVWNFGIGYPF